MIRTVTMESERDEGMTVRELYEAAGEVGGGLHVTALTPHRSFTFKISKTTATSEGLTLHLEEVF